MAQCYFPNATPSPDDTPCNQVVPHSACCPKSSLCLTNGYCLGIGPDMFNVLVRSSCTDLSWADPGCPTYCRDIYADGRVIVVAMGGADLTKNPGGHANFCCDGVGQNNSTSCAWSTNGSHDQFQLRNGLLVTERSTGAVADSYQLNTSTNALGVTITTTAMTVTTATTATTATTTATIEPQRTETQSRRREVTIGVAIGTPLSALLLAVCALSLFQTVRLRRERKDSAEERRDFTRKLWESGTSSAGERYELAPDSHVSQLNSTPVMELGTTRADAGNRRTT